MSTAKPRRVVFAAGSGTQALDVVGPMDVFTAAAEVAGGRPYRLQVASPSGTPVDCSSGLRLDADGDLDRIRGPIDTLVVAGGDEAAAAAPTSRLVGAVDRLAPQCRRVASVCSGAFVLAAAGLLDGRRATTHWRLAEDMRRRFSAVRVEPDRIFTSDSGVWTSAGVTAGIDLAMAMVEADLGPDVAARVARLLVVFLRRPGGQSQFSTVLRGQETRNRPLSDLQVYIASQLTADLSVEALAARVHLSPRQFARVFAAELGMPPARYVAQVRIEEAKRQLESTESSLAQIARACGFSSAEAFSRVFNRIVGVPPATFRRRFAARLVAPPPP